MILSHSFTHSSGRALGRALGLWWLTSIGNAAVALPTCTIATGATISFANVVALASTADQISNSGSSFWVNCSTEVQSAPSLYSPSMPRVLRFGSYSIPLALSTEAPGGPELPYASPGMPLNLQRTGHAESVVLYAKIQSMHFRSLPAGNYSASLTLTLEY